MKERESDTLFKCWKWNCHDCGWCCAESASVEFKQRSRSMKCALCLILRAPGRKISSRWSCLGQSKILAMEMFVWIACRNDGASISKSKQSLKKIIQELRGMYLFIFCTQFWISFEPNIRNTLLWSVFQWAVLTPCNRYLSNLLGPQKFPFVIGLQRNGSVLSFFGTRNSWNAFNLRGTEQKLVLLLFLRNKRQQNLRKKICFYVDPDPVLIFYFYFKRHVSKKASFREWKQRTTEKAIPDELLSCFWLRKG